MNIIQLVMLIMQCTHDKLMLLTNNLTSTVYCVPYSKYVTLRLYFVFTELYSYCAVADNCFACLDHSDYIATDLYFFAFEI